MAVRRWDIKLAMWLGAGCGLGAAAYQIMAARDWAGIDSNAITQILAGGIGGAFCFGLATKIRNWWVVDRLSRVARRCEQDATVGDINGPKTLHNFLIYVSMSVAGCERKPTPSV